MYHQDGASVGEVSRTTDYANRSHKDRVEHNDIRRAKRVLAKCSDANRASLERALVMRQNRGIKASSNAAWADAVRRADEWAQGRFLGNLGPDDWIDFIAVLRNRYATSTVYTVAACVKATLPILTGQDEAPKAIRRALSAKEPSRRPKGRVIKPEEFRTLLKAASELDLHGCHDLQRLQIVALLWVLRDSGFRASELLALRNGSVQWSGQHAAYLSLPTDAPRLKTGPREIAVAKCVPALKTWLEVHPARADARAPLFPGVRSLSGRRLMHYTFLQQLMRHLGDVTGINDASDREKPLTLHDFRHTRATEAARANWHPTKMEAYFGWAPGSKMAARYSHLARSDLRDQVLRDAGLLPTGEGAPRDEQPVKTLKTLLRALLEED